ncbi:PREDICTED: pentatricopeptide repeat-containing protein At1g80150, mitochondrial isoform X1 [Nicotiana attenuata]|uniref:Pentatricopeptide repeat-containing protein, mitochondrial n=1 Tax=Nicotiana attenuata TaxID=49451 RepID=A0A1J6IC22_NICAT|nr:PREDICTED: pentatricopeptide repeat-containing protein At1g80150, mitochondrial isoform X1 [Nicotiana attenuata]XP_019247334.1 PREDICTED: pentatricopeptide repeat-containing protein At1g80150, mitochondrial isoform X1 [Nicotiana attenuata]XP_019247335.1 PREDICTED: pentatricopeptide repeat-containing protein At1g80150, mitochondrial isoform X1 [Nicotiana attenuata]XP_019247337.1 PREDICTED: pentatricopeptide repeat-containing protein At1g80150, mitochondrial isoform X1 [Nicotiana attenuata]XP_
MLALRLIRRFGTASHIAAATAIASSGAAGKNSSKGLVSKRKPLKVDEPALIKLKKERNPGKLFQLFKENAHNKVVVENRFVFEDTVSRLAGAGRFDYIENLLEHQKTLPQGRREGFIIRLIMLYGKAGMTQHAVNTFYDMHLYGCPRTVKSFNAALKVLTQSRDLKAIESFLWDVPEKFSINIDILSVNTVISSFCEMGILEKAYLVMVEMEKLGITPDVFTYTTLISAFYKVNRWQIGDGLWNLMVGKGCMPNVATFNVRIQFLVNVGLAWEANKLLLLMKRIGITPDEVTYNLVIKGFCRAENLDMAKRIYSALCGTGFKPNAKIYQTMIHYLSRAGEFDLAYSMCRDSMQKNWFPSLDSIKKLLEGLCKDGTEEKMGKARFLIILAKKKIPPFSSDALNVMQSIIACS